MLQPGYFILPLFCSIPEACQRHDIHNTSKRKIKPAIVIDISITGKNKPSLGTNDVRYQSNLIVKDAVKFTKYHGGKQRHQADTVPATIVMASVTDESSTLRACKLQTLTLLVSVNVMVTLLY